MMIFAVGGTVLLLLAILTILLVVKSAGNLGMNNSVHKKVLVSYLALLFIVFIAAEVMAKTMEFEQLTVVEGNLYGFDVREAIEKDLPIPNRLIATQRTHEIDGKFTIPNFPKDAVILIERTADRDNVIEETVFRPEMMVEFDGMDGTFYDVSHKIKIELPAWDSHSMYVPMQPPNHITYTFYHDSNIVNQLSGKPSYGYNSGSVSGMMTVYLKVPESIELDLPQSTDEFENYTIEVLP
ncbi:hypothetical protein DV702_13145 [Sporosarcina sp. PTS2304]|uniref:hypothetical protein n=1 Tax=Sporosarcina sp. PTS2304 TaxID=2283194 RepID=UPI000E0D935F|nr:hypothetical protein [Sporosarcina sp. PTS2304]AXI00583.1 hypothetical protein DV702_13145 [Sporosarcina sp. PTS2304]